MDDTLKFAFTVLAGIVGWLAVHWFSMSRDRRNKIRDLKTKYLIEVFQKFERNLHVPKLNKSEMESALADIQLFGENEEIELAKKFMNDFTNQGGADLSELLELLRANLRKELKLEPPNSEMAFFRLTQKEPEKQTNQLGVNQQ